MKYSEELIESLKERAKTLRRDVILSIGVGVGCEKEVVDMVRGMVENLFTFDEILETVAGGVVTGHCGKNTLGVLFIAE